MKLLFFLPPTKSTLNFLSSPLFLFQVLLDLRGRLPALPVSALKWFHTIGIPPPWQGKQVAAEGKVVPVPRLPSAPNLSLVLCDSSVAEHPPDMSSEPECQEPVQMQGVCLNITAPGKSYLIFLGLSFPLDTTGWTHMPGSWSVCNKEQKRWTHACACVNTHAKSQGTRYQRETVPSFVPIS